MSDKLIFLNNSWFWPVVIGAMILLIAFLLKEWFQSGKKRFILKSIFSILAVLSLAIIALKPAIPQDNKKDKIAILTEGYKQDQLDSLKSQNRKLKIVDYDLEKMDFNKLNTAEEIYLLGSGIKPYDFWLFEDIPVSFLRNDSVKGIVKLKYDTEIELGKLLNVDGIYQNPVAGNKLILEGPGGASLDSISFKKEKSENFRLIAKQNIVGKYLFRLVEKDSLGAVVSSDPVPVKFTEKANLKVLVLNSFPTFETRYLKNFIAESGHQLLLRSQVTTGKFKYEYFNMPRTNLGALSAENLNAFDLLIVDAGTLRTLPAAQLEALETSVEENGLGIFIQPDEGFFNGAVSLSELGFLRDGITETSLEEWSGSLQKQPFQLKENFGVEVVHASENKILSAYKRKGEGRIGSSVFANTYQLILEGNAKVYREIWSEILNNLSKKKNSTSEWNADEIIAFKDEPFHFELSSENLTPEVENMEGAIIPLKRDIDITTRWEGTTWPRKTGWNTLKQDTISSFDYYVSNSSHWKSLSAAKTLKENRMYFNGKSVDNETQKVFEAISPLWFYIIFLLSVGILWLEPKWHA